MRRILKHWLRISMTMIAAGVALVILSFALGARGGYAYFGDGGLRIVPVGDAIVVREMDLAAFDTIQVRARSSSIELIESDRYGIELRLPAYAGEPNWSIANGKLTIDAYSGRSAIMLMNIGFQSDLVRIYYPRQSGNSDGADIGGTVFKSVDLSTTSGSVKIAALMADDLRINTGSGAISVDISHFRQAVVQSKSGGIAYKGKGDAASLTISTISGGIKVDAAGCGAVDLNTRTGGISLGGDTLPNAQLRVASSSGSISVDVSAWMSLTAESGSGDIRIKGKAEGATFANARSGSLAMTLRGDERNFSYELSSRSGTIRIGGIRMGNSAKHISEEEMNTVIAQTSSGNISLDFG